MLTKEFWKAALIRAIRTIAQTAVATIGTGALLTEINWLSVGSASLVAGILSILTSIATGLPEVQGLLYPNSQPNKRINAFLVDASIYIARI